MKCVDQDVDIKANAKLNENTPLMAFSVTHLLYVIGSEVQGCVN